MGHTLRRSAITLLLVAVFSTANPGFAQAGIDLAVHYVEGVPINNEIAYDVNVYLSVVDDAGNPIRDLTKDAFTVTEDSQKIDIASLALADNEPINIVLVLDTSGTMSGTKIKDAKDAASNFVSRLRDNDRVAIVTFDDNIKTRIDFTADYRSATDQIALIEVNRGAGTCLYDAAYEAVQMTATLPSGRRALVLFTDDGVDQTRTGKKPCSRFTIDDVIRLASTDGTRTPIYTLDLSALLTEANSLKRLSELTGGHYLHSNDSSELESTFQLLSNQLRSQYSLKYRSVAAPGAHTLAVNVNYQNSQDNDTRNFLLPALLPQMTFLAPMEGETVGNRIKVAVALQGQGATIDRVEFKINDQLAGVDDTTPYDVELDLSKYPEGNLTLSAIAYGSDNSELANKSISILRATTSTVTPTVIPEETPTAAPPNTIALVGGGLAALGLITILILVFVILRQRNQGSGNNRGDDAQRREPSSQARRESAISAVDADRTMDSYGEDSDALGALTIEASDDPSMIGHRFEITSSLVTLGRSAENDINFPKDNPVSRRHAEIYERNGRLFLKEVETMDSSGVYNPPKYGTFVNELPLGAAEVALNTGDEIQLGKRVRLRVEAYQKADEDESLTYDDMDDTASDPDKTQDSF